MIKNIENDKEIKLVVYELLIIGKNINYNPYTYEKGIMCGIFKKNYNNIIIFNMIFEELIYNYLLEQENIRKMHIPVTAAQQKSFVSKGKLDLEKILIKFQQFMIEEYRKEDERFYEAQGRLIFLAYLKPILNGVGFYFVEPETRENKRLDITIVFGKEKYIIELKLWNGKIYEEKGRNQLVEYLKIQNLTTGYLLIFNFNKNKKNTDEWISIDNK